MNKYMTILELPRNPWILGSLLAAYERRQKAPADRKPYGSKYKYVPADEKTHAWPGRSPYSYDY
jgi:hypothetical protein